MVREMDKAEMPEDGFTYYCDVDGSIYKEDEILVITELYTKDELEKAREEGRREIAHKIIELDENTPDYEGYSELLEIGGKYFRSWDAESYSSGIDEVTKEEFDRLLEYKLKTKEDEK